MNRYLYGVTDIKFVRSDHLSRTPPKKKYKYTTPDSMPGKIWYDKNDVSIEFKVSPDTLLNLAAKVVDAIPLPMVFTWDNVGVCRWIREYGYPQYQRTFRDNLINGRTLLLIDASALSRMNIKDFDHIRHIAYGIRCLFYFELTKFARSISLAPQYYMELYKLMRVKTGRKYESQRRSDLFRRMQLIREKELYLSHWEELERWLAFEPLKKYPELFGDVHRHNLYKCKTKLPVSEKTTFVPKICNCFPPCTCYWSILTLRKPWRFTSLRNRSPDISFKGRCEHCVSPCTCNWTSTQLTHNHVLGNLQGAMPQKYGPKIAFSRHQTRQFSLSEADEILIFKRASKLSRMRDSYQ